MGFNNADLFNLFLILAALLFRNSFCYDQSIKNNLAQNEIVLEKIIKETKSNLFILFGKRGCKYSDNILDKISEAYGRIISNHDYSFQFIFYFCKEDGYCGEDFETEGYPELRYYPTPVQGKMNKNFILYKQPLQFDVDELYLFFKNRLDGISFKKHKRDIDGFLKEQMKSILRERKKLLVFCGEDYSEKEINKIKMSVRYYQDVLSVMVDKCGTQLNIQNQGLHEYFEHRKEKGKSVGLIKFENEEIDYFDGKIKKEKFNNFVKLHRKEILCHLNKFSMNKIMGFKYPTIILFMDEKSDHLKEPFQELAYSEAGMKNTYFVYHVLGQNSDRDYKAAYLRNILGVSRSELPSIRVIHTQDNNIYKRLKFYVQPAELNT